MGRESKDCWYGWKNTPSIWNPSHSDDAARPSLHQDDESSCGRQRYWSDWNSASSSWDYVRNDYAAALPPNHLSEEYAPKPQARWDPYWVKCKSHGWQQCPACIAEIASTRRPSQKPTTTPAGDSFQRMRKNSPPRKRLRQSVEDIQGLQTILALIHTLSVNSP